MIYTIIVDDYIAASTQRAASGLHLMPPPRFRFRRATGLLAESPTRLLGLPIAALLHDFRRC